MALFMPPAFLSSSSSLRPYRAVSQPHGLFANAGNGHANQLLHKNEARHRRLEELRRTLDSPPPPGRGDGAPPDVRLEKEYAGLRSLGDPYDPGLFTSEHARFKASHNEAFASLARNLRPDDVDEDGSASASSSCNVFYLDGPDGGTTSHLLDAGFHRENLYVANEWEDSASALRSDPFHLSARNCVLGRAQDVLRYNWDGVEFAAYYLDGCGGQTEPIVEMVDAVFSRRSLPKAFGIGFTLTQAEPGGRELIDRVQDVARSIMTKSKAGGYDMRHVGDDPGRYGVDPSLSRKHDNTCTSWLVCRKVV